MATNSARKNRQARIAAIKAEAEHVFGSREAAKQWLESTNLALGGPPLILLETEAGASQVRQVLNAIAHGGVA